MIPRSRLILHALSSALAVLAAFAVAAFLLADVIGYCVEHAPYVGTLIVGWMLGVLTVGALREHDYRRRTRGLAVLGRDAAIPRAVLRARVPSGPAVPTRWRNAKGHVRYGIERDGGAE